MIFVEKNRVETSKSLSPHTFLLKKETFQKRASTSKKIYGTHFWNKSLTKVLFL
jgi:hypothetical protein